MMSDSCVRSVKMADRTEVIEPGICAHPPSHSPPTLQIGGFGANKTAGTER